MLQHCSDNTPTLPILVNYSTVIALISKMKSPTLRKCLDYRVCNDEISAQIQKVNKAHIYCNTVKCSAELTA